MRPRAGRFPLSVLNSMVVVVVEESWQTWPAWVTVTVFLVNNLLMLACRFVRAVDTAAAFELKARSPVVWWSSSRAKLGGREGGRERE
jgi:hypothetical protein